MAIRKTHEWILVMVAEDCDPLSGWTSNTTHFRCDHCGSRKRIEQYGPNMKFRKYCPPRSTMFIGSTPICAPKAKMMGDMPKYNGILGDKLREDVEREFVRP